MGSHRFSPITPDDHAGSVWIATLLCLIYSVVTLALRGHLRWKMYGLDDYLALTATAIQVGQVVAVIVGLHHGLGKTQELLRQDELAKASRATFAAQILFIMSATITKASTLCLMMRLFNLVGPRTAKDLRSKVLYWISLSVLCGMGLWGILSIVAVSVNCSVPGFIQGDRAQCGDQFLRWQLITAFDVATECILVLITVFVVWPVHLALSMKFQVVLAFAFRLPVAMLSILHLHYVAVYTGSDNPGIAIVSVIVIQEVQLCWSLISATIPNLKSFVRSFSSGFGIQLDPSVTQAYGSGRSSGRGSGRGSGRLGRLMNAFELSSVLPGNNGTAKSKSARRSYHDAEQYPPIPEQDPRVCKPTMMRENDSIHSGGSQDHIIRKDVQWNIQYEADQGRA
ncbi:uncharacterized protein Z520_01227 [Fonsecaea multimorphosa CBS 102226]|uniref:Rhodopsin domain-containing protein n=1 Tax=Fonsecaea multimorphosa CBS 102226 TaxID=1442371 RepID=A0A0D2J064_9EURO|nr:uncharacterized protein Z520_01227 [Fonsecaea multimorphosa CBS 102226]KIY02762.1 hypothetical protein Z520_01227 [Fonsecaea multimorphosa CBS 102226]OAL31185.1 hypothetical protein AYO22_01218 [Fonsecaea multimorphosa]